jgi:sec-independent protein translocase protein TatC
MSEQFSTFWGHVASLREALVKIFVVIAIGMATALFFQNALFILLTKPLNTPSTAVRREEIRRERLWNESTSPLTFTLPADCKIVNSPLGSREIKEGDRIEIPPYTYVEMEQILKQKLVTLSPLEGIATALKISFWVGVLGTAPLWTFFLITFIAPALYPEEKRLILPFFLFAFLFLMLGLCFAFFITLPLANEYLGSFSDPIARNLWSLSQYCDYTLMLLMGNGLAFELCLALLFLIHLRVVTAEMLITKRRYAVVGAFIVGAVLTPPDIFTQFLLAVPLLILYEVGVGYAKFRAWRIRNFKGAAARAF